MAYTSYEAWVLAEKFRAHPEIYNFIPRFADQKVVEMEEQERTWRVARDAENSWRETVWFDNVQRCHFELLRAYDSEPNAYSVDSRWFVNRGLLKKAVAGEETQAQKTNWVDGLLHSLKEGELKLEKGVKNLFGIETTETQNTGKAAPYAEQKIFEKSAPLTEKKLESTGKIDSYVNQQKHQVQHELTHQVKLVN